MPQQNQTPEETLKEKLGEIQTKAKETEVKTQATARGLPTVELEGFPIGPETISAIPEEIARRLKAVCILYTDKEVRVAAVNPDDPAVTELIYQLGERTHAHVALLQISERSLGFALQRYASVPTVRKIVKGVAVSEEELSAASARLSSASVTDLTAALTGTTMSDLVTTLIAAALKAEASDIHLEAEAESIVIRFRLDGILNPVATLPKDFWPKIISRVKLLSTLKLNITDRPQDGRFTIFLKNDKLDVRVSTIPTSDGESVVMRILRGRGAGLAFDDLGIRGRAFEILKKEVERPNGMIVTTGPTGSGKTTTLYAVLQKLNEPGTKIITLEDPIEYKIPGINQSQIDPSKEYTFAAGLRSILRQDPDVILVGEMRDLETAETAIQAALTGHLVLSTIHTNSAAGAIPRFLALGVKPFLLAPAVNAVVGQRLVRKLCPSCKQPETLPPDAAKRVHNILAALPANTGEQKTDVATATFFKAVGCAACNNLGYKGRIGIYEVMQMSKEIEAAILAPEGMSEYKMQELAVAAGMVTMVADGLLKAADGITSVDEVFRVAE